MQPQQYPQYPPQQYPQYPPPQPAYPPQPQYPPSGQWAQYPPQPPMPAAVSGSLDEFFDQPGGGSGASWKFKDKPMGTTYSGIVARPIGSGDVRQQTGPTGPVFFKDGRPKFVMIVPMIVQPTQEYPEGTAAWWVKGQARDELVRAMAEAGAPEGPPEAGAAIQVTLIGSRPIPNMNPAYQYRVHYVRPNGAPAAAMNAAPGAPTGYVSSAAPTANPVTGFVGPTMYPNGGPDPYNQGQPGHAAPQPMYQDHPGQPHPDHHAAQHPYQGQYATTVDTRTYAPIPPAQPAPPVQAPAPAPPAQVATSLTPDQQALLAKLTGG